MRLNDTPTIPTMLGAAHAVLFTVVIRPGPVPGGGCPR